MNARSAGIAIAMMTLTAALMMACPGQDEARKPDEQGPAEDETGQQAQPASPDPEAPPCAKPPCAE